MKIWLRIITLALLVAACGSETGGPDGGVIASPDGRATLTLAESSLPEGVSLEDLSLKVVSIETTEIGIPVLAIQLLPDGLALDEPATLEFDLPDSALAGFIVIHQSGDTIEFLEGSTLVGPEGTRFSTTVDHFSSVGLTIAPPALEVSLMLDPPEIFEDEEQGATATITASTEPFSIWFHLSQDPANSWRLFEFGLPTDIEFPSSNFMYWGPSRGTSWDAHENRVEIVETRRGWEASASSTCIKANTENVFFAAHTKYTLKIFKKGAPVTRADLSMFTDVLGGESASPVERVTFYRLGDIEAGDEIRVRHTFSETTPTVCLGESSVNSFGSSSAVSEHSVMIGSIDFSVQVPGNAPSGGDLDYGMCTSNASSGDALTGITVYITIGNDPGGPLASHDSGVTDADGCVSGVLRVNEGEGSTQLFVSDGAAVVKVTDIQVGPGTSNSSATTTAPPPMDRSSSNTSYNVDATGQSGAVAINADDCFGDDGPTPCTGGIDITGFEWEPVAGAPNLLQCTITFAEPAGETEEFLLNMGIRGNESDGLGTNYIVEDGESSWNFPGSDGPLPGEAVFVDDDGHLVIIRDLSSLTGTIRISIRTRTLTDPQIGDAVQISNVMDRG